MSVTQATSLFTCPAAASPDQLLADESVRANRPAGAELRTALAPEAAGSAQAAVRGCPLDVAAMRRQDVPLVLATRLSAGGAPAGYALGDLAGKALQNVVNDLDQAIARATKTSTSGDWGFLNGSKSIEDKLFLFMKTVTKKNDEELVRKMKEYKEQYTQEGKKDDGGGLLGSILGGIGDFFSGGFLGSALKEVGGLVLAAGATAFGMPQLAPVALAVGKDIGAAVGKAAGKALGTSSSASTSKSSGEAGSPDERLAMLEIQRLCDKQKQMFDCVSNILKTTHETAMTAVNNIR